MFIPVLHLLSLILFLSAGWLGVTESANNSSSLCFKPYGSITYLPRQLLRNDGAPPLRPGCGLFDVGKLADGVWEAIDLIPAFAVDIALYACMPDNTTTAPSPSKEIWVRVSNNERDDGPRQTACLPRSKHNHWLRQCAIPSQKIHLSLGNELRCHRAYRLACTPDRSPVPSPIPRCGDEGIGAVAYAESFFVLGSWRARMAVIVLGGI
ncbi:hypothetical protein K432DRAFT_397165 [Lepidopterella palustris CBS 459.81]|uniref:Uncharacterized protein n=1 Tax=Lepidopterella palustris CBS 459.81 TaxID=1314670 RepID=A0A8E2E1B6_9PEZI|nr:hypothetical protein K432DRAFT_397165 [Lepidopterella palustris CBS 459.81]